MIETLKNKYNITYPVHANLDKNYDIIYQWACEFYNDFVTEKNRDINLIYSGSSGCIISTIFFKAIKDINPNLKIEMVYIRKKGEKSHDVYNPNYDLSRLNIFVDDHIFEGHTINHCYNEIQRYIKYKKRGAEKLNIQFEFDYAVVSWINNRINITNTKKVIHSYKVY